MSDGASQVTKWFPTSLTQLKKYLRTWETLLLHPADFFRATLQNKQRSYWPATWFLLSAFVIADLASSIVSCLALWFLDPGQPMDLKAVFIHSAHEGFVLAIICLGLESFLFYAILRNWFGHKLAVRTNTPFWRIFTELAYANSPVVLINSVLGLIDVVLASGFLLAFAVLATKPGNVLDDAPDWLSGALVALVVGTYFLVLVGPLLAVTLYYYTMLLTSLFHVSRKRAIILSLVVSTFAGVPSSIYTIWAGIILTPFNLSSTEMASVQTIRGVGALVTDYSNTYHRQPSMREVRAYVNGQLKNVVYQAMHAQEIAELGKLDGNDSADGYRYSVLHGRLCAYVRADPLTCGGDSKRSFIGDAWGGRLYSSDRCSPAKFTDTPVILIGN